MLGPDARTIPYGEEHARVVHGLLQREPVRLLADHERAGRSTARASQRLARSQGSAVIMCSVTFSYLFLLPTFKRPMSAPCGYNEIVTSLPAIDDATTAADGQQDPRYQGRAVPHNLATLAQGTADDWIRHREGGENAAGATGETTKHLKGLCKVD